MDIKIEFEKLRLRLLDETGGIPSAIDNALNDFAKSVGLGSVLPEKAQTKTIPTEEDEFLFKQLFDHAGDANYLLCNGVYIEGNRKGLELFCLDSEEKLIGKSPANFSPMYQFDGKKSTDKILEMNDIAHYNHSHTFEWIHANALGETFYTEVTLTDMTYKGMNVLHANLRKIEQRKKVEQRLLESQSNLASIFSSTDSAFCMINSELQLVHFNDNFYESSVLFYGKAPVYGMNVSDLFAEKTNIAWDEYSRKVLRGERFKIERKVEKNDIDMYFEMTFNPIIIDKEVTGFTLFINDISQYRQTQEKLEKINSELETRVDERTAELSEYTDFLQVLLNTLPVPVFFKDLSGKYIDCNMNFSNFFERAKSEIIGKTPREIWSKDIIDSYYLDDDRELEPGITQSYATKVVAPNHDLRDAIIYRSMFYDKKGGKKGIVGIIFDITEQKRLEHKIKKGKDTLMAMINAITESALLLDKNGVVITANETSVQRLKKSHEQVVGTSIYDLLPTEVSNYRRGFIEQTMKTGKPVQFEDVNGDVSFISDLYPVFDGNGEVHQVAVFSVDVTKKKEMEANLAKEQSMLETLINSAPDLIFMKDPEGKYINCNPAFCEYMGKAKEEIIGSHDTVLNTPDEAESFSVFDNTVLVSGKAKRQEQSLSYPDGRVVIFDTVKTPFFGINGELKGLIGISRDITEFKRMEDDIKNINQELESIIDKRTVKLQQEIHERIRAEEALKKSREMYRNLFNDVSVGIYRSTPQGYLLLANPALVRMLGYNSLDEIMQKNILHDIYINSVDREKFIETTSRSHDEIDFESVWRNKNGDRIVIHEKARAIRDFKGDVIYFEGIAEDITARRHAENIQQAVYKISEAAYFVQKLEDLYAYIHKIINELLPANNFYISLYDDSKEQISFPYIVDEQESPEPSKLGPYPFDNGLTEYIIREGRSYLLNAFEISELERNGTITVNGPMPVYWLGVPMKTSEGKTIGIIVIQSYDENIRIDTEAKDILAFVSTQVAMVINRKRIEEALEGERKYLADRVIERTEELSALNAELERAVRTKDEFLANMSHELRTPLNAILGLSEIMLKHKDLNENERHKKSLSTIRESGSHLLNLINDILDLSKIEAGKLDLNIENVEVGSIANSSMQFVRQLANKKGIDLTLDIQSCPAEFKADPVRLKQILINLLNNAVKFTMERGKVGLKITSDEERGTIYFSVWDTGIGISEEHLNKLFKPFVQVSSNLSRDYEGTGLGLSLVAKLTEMHGGSVSVESIPGEGSSFTIALPMRMENVFIEQLNISEEIEKLKNIKRAVIIEDSNSESEQLAANLNKLEITPLIYGFDNNLQEFLAIEKPDVILLDILLWERSGWDVLSDLKRDEATRDIPVIVTTVLQERPRALALGADEFITKPFSLAVLTDTLSKVSQKIISNNESSNDGNSEMNNLPLILLAEDNEANLQTLEAFLEYGGYRVTIARNGKEAVDSTLENSPELILMDIQMPKMDGLEAIRLIKSKPGFDAIPIIALTALAMPGDKERCLSAGADEYISKPVNFDTLIGAMDRLMAKHTLPN